MATSRAPAGTAGRAARAARSSAETGRSAGAVGGSTGAADASARAPGRAAPAVGGDAGADPEEIARQICLRMLTAAPRTRAQLASALQRRGVPEEAAEAVLGRFADVKLIDDAMFASAWVESRHYSKGLSGRALAAELRRRGVPAGDIKAAVDGLAPEQEIATARSLVRRRLVAIKGQPKPADVRRLIGVLARKGYSPALAYRVTREALEQAGMDRAGAWLDLSDGIDGASGADEADEFADGPAGGEPFEP